MLLKFQEAIWTIRRFRQSLSRHSLPQQKRPARVAASSPIDVPAWAASNEDSSPKIYLDVTALAEGRAYGGIESTCRALSDAAVKNGTAIPVVMIDAVPFTILGEEIGQRVDPGSGDVFVILDHYWSAFDLYPDALKELRERGVFVATCIYDLIPLDFPALTPLGLSDALARHLDAAAAGSDLVFSISQSAARDIRRYFVEHQVPHEKDIDHFTLGADAAASTNIGEVRKSIKDLFGRSRPFLAVGSLMPHKGHLVTVQAFHQLWDEGHDDTFVIIGPKSHNAIEESIRLDPYFDRFLFRIDDASDAEVAWAYEHAECLVQSSIAEGFGLPIIEANLHGLPIIASDISVFREIGLDSLDYFEPCDAADLASKLKAFDRSTHREQKTIVMDWDASSRGLHDMLMRRCSSAGS